MLALPGRLGVPKRRLDGDDGIEAGKNVGDGDADLLRLAAGRAGDRHQARHALHDEVVAGARGIGAVLTEAGDGAVDEAGIDRLEALVVQPVFLQAAELEVLDQHVGCGDELSHGLSALGRREIERDGALAAIAGVVIGGRQVFPVVPFHEGRPPFAGIVAALRVLHLDDVGAEVGQHLPGPGTGKDAGKLDDADALERWFGHDVLGGSSVARLYQARTSLSPALRCAKPCYRSVPSAQAMKSSVMTSRFNSLRDSCRVSA